MAKQLVAFYSRADENYVSGQLKMLEIGNTEIVAKMIAEKTGADLFKIEQVQPYAADYNECIAQAQEDQQRNARLELTSYLDQIEEYDVIYVGYPNYWSTMPMAVFTFLERYDFTGKIIKPFCTHEGSGLGKSIADIKKICPKAIVQDGLAIYGSSAARAQADVENWL